MLRPLILPRPTAANLEDLIDHMGLIIIAKFHGQLRKNPRARTFDALQETPKARDSRQLLITAVL
jgi:hypothetical protein